MIFLVVACRGDAWLLELRRQLRQQPPVPGARSRRACAWACKRAHTVGFVDAPEVLD